MNQTHISQAQLRTGSIIIKDQIPSLFIGRNVVATVLSRPKEGMALVSMFGRRLLVETTMDLTKGQVLNLKVHALQPKVILKPLEAQGVQRTTTLAGVSALIERLVGKLGDVPLKAFNVREILEEQIQGKSDPVMAQFISALVEEAAKYPQALAFLLIPIVQEDSRGRAKVVVEKDREEGFVITFDMETDHMGVIGCTARINDGIDVEIRTGSDSLADFLRSHIQALYERLAGIDVVRRLEVVMSHGMQPNLDMLV
jgi:hypothetical protein